ncbi:ATPase domain-containing protein [Corallococcus llansteffanensis]|uniref:non-specific serine/threonine protein kinase n=1 Tax=Corallococcus llansteffanensis TaxID=2316731 RepID=A0A3A8Q1B9_9BACT|nr:ATPase domain-containing protein [Corallococcus llansteffanensis]RKH58622.1 circadian clock protein KaiC [Corallococcus llansteffanensis]
MTVSEGEKIPTGIPGLNDVLGGGLPRKGIYLVQGNPGVGKTTLGLQFLLEGQALGEQGLYVALTETRREVELIARSHGWSLDDLPIWEITPAFKRIRREDEQTMFHPAEVELDETTRPIFEEIDRVKPARVVIDSLSEIRLLSREPLRYRRQLLLLKQFFLERECTVLLIDSQGFAGRDSGGILETLIGGLIVLEKTTPAYGTTRRRLMVDKLLGVSFREGYHDYQIKRGGLVVYPRLVAAEHPKAFSREQVSSAVPELDDLLGGGLERGTSTLILGAAGTGKSSLASQYAVAAARRGEKSVLFTFEESVGTWMARASALWPDAESHLRSGTIRVVHVDPAELSPGELSSCIREAVEKQQVQMVVIDSLNGYLQSVPEESFLILHLHELLTYLGQKGVTTILNMAQYGLLGPTMDVPVDVSYLSDCVLLLRFFEAAGEVRQSISAVKKRSGRHERTIREFQLDTHGIRVGGPLKESYGVLTGMPSYRGGEGPLLPSRE